jgi:alpha-beta hydrolase superfamily lysophospholipase
MKTVIFVHGMFMTARCWDGWVPLFGARGLRALAPSWPSHGGAPDALRLRHPDPALGALTLDRVVGTFEAAVRAATDEDGEPPLLVGHSMGGLVVQKLLARGLGAAGVGVHSAPPRGVFAPSWSFLRANLPVFNLLAWNAPVLPTPAQFRYAFCHTLSVDEARRVYDEYVVPESRRIGRAPLGAAGAIDLRVARPPLLLVAGSADHIIPARLNHANLRAWRRSPSVTDWKLFPGRTHYTLGDAGWEEVATFVLDWATGLLAQGRRQALPSRASSASASSGPQEPKA